MSKCNYLYIVINTRDSISDNIKLIWKAKRIVHRNTEINIFLWGCPSESLLKKIRNSGVQEMTVFSCSEKAEYDEKVAVKYLYEALRDKNKKDNILLIVSSIWGRAVASRLALKFQTGLTADCVDIKIDEESNKLIQSRMLNGGTIKAKITCDANGIQMATVQGATLEDEPIELESDFQLKQIEVESELADIKQIRINTQIRGQKSNKHGIYLVCGRGVKSRENLQYIYEFAKKCNWGFGATRPVVEEKWIEREYQIGQSGSCIEPSLYICFGVSGAVQHMIGVRGNPDIIAVNLDSNAEIKNYADVFIHDDAMEVFKYLEKSMENLV